VQFRRICRIVVVQAEHRVHRMFDPIYIESESGHKDESPLALNHEAHIPIADIPKWPKVFLGHIPGTHQEEPPLRPWLMKRSPSWTVIGSSSFRSFRPCGVISARTLAWGTSTASLSWLTTHGPGRTSHLWPSTKIVTLCSWPCSLWSLFSITSVTYVLLRA